MTLPGFPARILSAHAGSIPSIVVIIGNDKLPNFLLPEIDMPAIRIFEDSGNIKAVLVEQGEHDFTNCLVFSTHPLFKEIYPSPIPFTSCTKIPPSI